MKIQLKDIHKLIQEPYISRGEEYSQKGLVKIISIQPESVKARIKGTRIYTVALTRKDNDLKAFCSCPAFTDFGPCKHIAATCFTVLNRSHGTYRVDRDTLESVREYEKLEKRLLSRKKSELVEIILNIANECPDMLYEYGISLEEEDDEL